MTKKVLIVTYYWPPAGGPGVQRWLKFVKYLPKYGIEPHVYCPLNPNYPIVDSTLNKEVPCDAIVVKQPIKEPYGLASLFSKKSTSKISSGIIPSKSKQSFIEKLLLFVRGNFFIPDARKQWIKPSVKFLSKYLRENHIDTVITTGPPHSMHFIGYYLKQNFNINWLADFRDPWTTIGYHKSLKLTSWAKKKHLELEQKIMQSADEIIVTSHNTKLEFQVKTDVPITVITNGYEINVKPETIKDSQFTISHIGSLLSDRNPVVLWKVLRKLVSENESFSKSFQLNLVGVVSNDILEALKKYDLFEYVNQVGYVSHSEAISCQQNSQLLVLIEIDSDETKTIIPGKLFEYMASQTPILAIGPKYSDVEKIIKSTNTGSYFLYKAEKELETKLLEYFNAYKKGALKTAPIGIEKYSREYLTGKLAKLISH